tara:strand:- start:7624 stop:8478 length:855 start_codon:yes stop_codon:yes gene_type:complete
MGSENDKKPASPNLGYKVIFLGTGTGKFARGKQLRATGGIILQFEDDQFHIDPGPGAVVRAMQASVNLRANTGILISHSHIGHCNDVNAVIDAMTYSGLDKQGVLISTNNVINGSEGHTPYLTKFHRDCLEKVIITEPGQRVGVNEIEIKALYAKHTESSTIGFKIVTPYFVLVYSSDTEYSAKLIEEYKGANILILNTPSPGEEYAAGNLNTMNTTKIIEKVNPKLAIIQHFSKRMLEMDPLQEAREIQSKTKCQVIAAKDGMAINPLIYGMKTRQQTLTKDY